MAVIMVVEEQTMPKASEAIKNFLDSKRNEHNADLLSRVVERIPNLEIQVNVRQGDGDLVADTTSTYSNGIDRWFSFRIPREAYTTTPSWADFEMSYSLADHCEAIGSTGWDWVAKESVWVGFDFDSLVGHAQGVGLSEEELNDIRTRCLTLDYVELRRSTSGRGLHMYVFLEGIQTESHTEHSAVASRVLDKISEDVGADFRKQVDVLGANLWIWHARGSAELQSFGLIKPASRALNGNDLPYWKDHIDIIRHRSRKVRITAMPENEQDIFEQLASAYQHVPLDDMHRLVRDELCQVEGCTTVWVQDHYLLQTHTVALQQVFDKLGLRGVFATNSPGTDLSTPNCFLFPQQEGAWKVFRFGRSTKEHASWDMSTPWTWCWFNREPSLASASAVNGGSPTKNGYQFPSLSNARDTLRTMGINEPDIRMHRDFKGRPVVVAQQQQGGENRIMIQVPKDRRDKEFMEGWNSSDKKGYWTTYLTVSMPDEPTQEYEHMVRCLETMESSAAGWAVKKPDGEWTRKTSSSVKTVLQAIGLTKPEAEVAMGHAEMNPWKLVCIPFADEYPGDRQWNLGAPQLRVLPAPREDLGGKSKHPHWDLLLDHLGKDLNKYIDPAKTGFHSGRDYLQGWMASVIKYPYEPLPYLFFFGPQNTGKSSFHEAWDVLVTGGVVKAARALTNKSDFNGELLGAIICVIEEVDLSRDRTTLDRIKDVVTCKQLSIRRMRTDSFMAPNTTHWVHCANDIDSVPVFDGDTRITMIYVDPPAKEIPKMILQERLREEAPYFLRTLLDFELPQVAGRLRIPVVDTDYKKQAINHQRSPLDVFLGTFVTVQEGSTILFSEFYDRFVKWLPEEEQGVWSKKAVSKQLPLKHATCTGTNNKTFVNNARWK